MYTQCPGCGTIFALRAWQLRRARGLVICGLCQAQFDAFESLAEQLPDHEPSAEENPAAGGSAVPLGAGTGPEATEEAPARPLDLAAVTRTGASEQGEAEEGAESVPGGREPDLTARCEEAPDPEWEQMLAELRVERPVPPAVPRRARSGWRRWLISGTVMALLATAAVHGSYLYRESLLELPGTRGWLEAVCRLYGCLLEDAQAYAVLEVEERWLEADPRRDDALMLGGVLVNTGEQRLPYPEMRLTLRDLDGHVTGERWVQPQDYVADSRMRARLKEGIAPDARVPVELYIARPEGGAESFSLAFRPPQ
ncbi:MAG: zinc-ribbon and DUF3426 domain-containing protein [Halorhodospira sp.]